MRLTPVSAKCLFVDKMPRLLTLVPAHLLHQCVSKKLNTGEVCKRLLFVFFNLFWGKLGFFHGLEFIFFLLLLSKTHFCSRFGKIVGKKFSEKIKTTQFFKFAATFQACSH